jgi:hypothetical protein
MLLNAAIITAMVITALLLLSRRLSEMTLWRAAITPLASIIGSGFLVLGPILDASYGYFAPAVMAALCGAAFAFGWAIRFNIAELNRDALARGVLEQRLETTSSWALAFAYIVSVTYYLNLFGAFGVSLTTVNDPTHARMLTTAVFALILGVGWTRGFKALESLEYASVTAKLAIIAGLMIGMAAFFWNKVSADSLVFNAPEATGWAAVTLAFGLIITVQGFETSRYLGKTYDAATRVRSMRLAQGVSTAIYVIYVGLIAYVFQRNQFELKETSIISMMHIVAPILPGLLVVAALAAQMSAAVADTGGSGGLFAELTKNRVNQRAGYLMVTGIGVALTWTANVFEIIAYASRAFALYYGLQALIAFTTARRKNSGALQSAAFLGLAVLGAAIVLFGQAVEV